MRRFVAALLFLLVGAAGADVVRPAAPEAASGFAAQPALAGRRFLVAASHPLAADAGTEILKAGGAAIDAAVAVQMVLTLVEPQSSGIGGGAFLLHFDGRRVEAYDGRESAPAAADEKLFSGADGQPLAFYAAVVGGRSVGVPGVLRALELAHKAHGKLPWARLFAPAIRLAEAGFPIGERLHALLERDPYLRRDAEAAAYFYAADGRAKPVGSVLRNPELAAVLRTLAEHGAGALYAGPIALAIVAKVRAHPTNPGRLSEADLAAYTAKRRPPLCRDYRRWTVCGMPPPSSGGLAVAQILAFLEPTDIAALPPEKGVPTARAVHLYSEAARLAYADRERYVADPDFVPWPAGLLAPDYLAGRARLIGERSLGQAAPGVPAGVEAAPAADRSAEFPATAHLSIVDAEGHALAMTTSVEDAFGARQMVRGFLLNNQLSDFSFVAASDGRPVANRVEAGKRPRSSMAPTLVFDRGSMRLRLVVGSPGGPQIINYVATTLIAALDWGLAIDAALALPHFGSRNGPTELEAGRVPPALVSALRARGHAVRTVEMTSGLQAIARVGERWVGAADPRRDGAVRGE